MAAVPAQDGHGTKALGPSDSSDSGSDVAGGDAPALLGDSDLDGDSDSAGTGERATVGRDDTQPASRDVAPDRATTADDPGLGLVDGPQSSEGETVRSTPAEDEAA
jgi:hypothetical protein